MGGFKGGEPPAEKWVFIRRSLIFRVGGKIRNNLYFRIIKQLTKLIKFYFKIFKLTGHSAVVARCLGVAEVPGSSPGAPI